MVTLNRKMAFMYGENGGYFIKVDFVLREATIIQNAPNLIKTQVL